MIYQNKIQFGRVNKTFISHKNNIMLDNITKNQFSISIFILLSIKVPVQLYLYNRFDHLFVYCFPGNISKKRIHFANKINLINNLPQNFGPLVVSVSVSPCTLFLLLVFKRQCFFVDTKVKNLQTSLSLHFDWHSSADCVMIGLEFNGSKGVLVFFKKQSKTYASGLSQ